jgi:hypothetical protein
MRNELALLAIMAVLFSPLAAASSNCPCLRPGAKGTIIKFLAREGTTTNVTLYPMEEAPSIGSVLQIYAGKTIGNDTLVIENLTITLYVNSVLKSETKTDSGGKAEFRIVEPGTYFFTGGDANATVEIGGVEEVTMIVDGGNTTDNQTVDNGAAANSTGIGDIADELSEGAIDESDIIGTPQKTAPAAQDAGFIYGTAFALMLILAFVMFAKKRKPISKKK